MQRYVFIVSSVFLTLIILGFLFANNILIVMSFIPLVSLAVGYFINIPKDITVKKSVSKKRATVGEILNVKLKVLIESGTGPIQICDLVPQYFELVDGSNFCVVWKGNKSKEIDILYKIKCTVSGVYPLNGTTWKSGHPVCYYWERGSCESDISVEITPRLLELKKVRGVSMTSKIPMPQGALASMGMTTHDFKEISLYYPGDPFKSINWKATSRNLLRGDIWPVVNKFEKEGKKSVWIFLDTSKVMGYGTNIKNVTEYSIEAVNGLGDYYLKQNCSLALVTYGGEDEGYVAPGSGRQQYFKILRELMDIKDYYSKFDDSYKLVKPLDEVVYSLRGHFPGLRPMFIIVTRFCNNNYYEIKKAVETMSHYTSRNGLLPSVLLLNIIGYELMAENKPEKIASDILQTMNRIISKDLRKKCIWIDWNPVKESLTGALLKQVVGNT
ncbi:DUF58 domain-containing protein [Herbivorax sp. ANBcel31]|uniref:DUF58 domain-containing protein n=1 Tax=Herbivorax sp. ANBcel31 TaxID=3069754 RepID=UPI0027B7D0E6|nr:DUF58 domain-containing protein [Herbivorax sp. ANBcel31]MDQ2087877.1 DUF58 domain-containing protein [Herbivorax sp. ANBcel31]